MKCIIHDGYIEMEKNLDKKEKLIKEKYEYIFCQLDLNYEQYLALKREERKELTKNGIIV